MKSTSEIGHAKNYENFGVMYSRVQGYGPRYNPSNGAILLPALQNIYTNTGTVMLALDNTKPPFILAVDTRQQVFNDMEKLAGRTKNALASSTNVTKAIIDDAKTIIRKIRGQRKSIIIVTPINPVAKTTTPPVDSKFITPPVQISASQQSYDQQLEHFINLVALVSAVPTYTPNETELQIASLNAFTVSLKNANDAVVAATTPYLTALQNRNNIMYAEGTGLVDIATEVKKYVKSVKTITLAEFRQISGLKFTRPRKKK